MNKYIFALLVIGLGLMTQFVIVATIVPWSFIVDFGDYVIIIAIWLVAVRILGQKYVQRNREAESK